MADLLVAIAEAIKDFLPTQTYTGLACTAENTVRRYAPIRSVEELKDHKVVVIPSRKDDQGRTCRDPNISIKYYSVAILVQMHVKNEDNATCDPIRTLSAEIEAHLRNADVQAGVPIYSVNDVVVSDSELLVQNNIFVTELDAMYRKG